MSPEPKACYYHLGKDYDSNGLRFRVTLRQVPKSSENIENLHDEPCDQIQTSFSWQEKVDGPCDAIIKSLNRKKIKFSCAHNSKEEESTKTTEPEEHGM